MSNLKSGIQLLEGENLIVELEAELWATSSNPIARFFGGIKKFLAAITGNSRSGFIVVTDKRVVEVATVKRCFCFTVGREVKYVLPNSVKEVGYTRGATFLCCCPAYYFYYESFTQRTSILLKGTNEAEAQKIVDAFYRAINA